MNLSRKEFLNKIKNTQSNQKVANFFIYQPQNTTVCNNFVGKHSQIVTGYSNIIVDDDSIYDNLFDNIQYFQNKYHRDANIISFAIQKTVLDYYGIGRPSEEFEKILFLKTQYDKGQNTSIKQLKGKRWATCMERSGLAYNLFRSLGYHCALIATDISLVNENCGHTFIVVELDNDYYIYDLICSKIYDKDMPSPLLCKLNKEIGKSIINGVIPSNFDLKNINFKTQSNTEKTITYHFYKTKNNEVENERN